MVEKIGYIKNPLTVISIFAGLTEVFGTVVLPFLNQSYQGIYIWFLMIFPTALVLLFFCTLHFNPKVLYAPSDYRNDESYERVMNGFNLASSDKQTENSITIELSTFSSEIKTLFYPVTLFRKFNALTDAVYFAMKGKVKPFTYGLEWVLRDKKTKNVLKHARMICNAGFGMYVDDERTLDDMGIKPGTVLEVVRP
jgi:hypothetical protein